MLPVLDKDTDYVVWLRQFNSYCALKEITDDSKMLSILPTFVHPDILVHASWDSRATLKSALDYIKTAWETVNRPSNPIVNFESIVFSDNIYELKRTIEKAAIYINASEETMCRKFISLLPQELEMAAYQFAGDLRKSKLSEIVDHIATLPSRQASGSSAHVLNTSAVHPSKSQMNSGPRRSYQYDRRNQNFRCYNCGEPNHLARNCLAPRATCSSCGGKHIVSMCPSSKNANQSQK